MLALGSARLTRACDTTGLFFASGRPWLRRRASPGPRDSRAAGNGPRASNRHFVSPHWRRRQKDSPCPSSVHSLVGRSGLPVAIVVACRGVLVGAALVARTAPSRITP